ncbi:MBL fold metallo-hydrolase [Halodesulfurarchaeum sp.]|uniref:MBL fold metallo-hydrolase n=1 Tax=Halodesulfurarchaeum sp. TaxID=1980530 RepID=UPI001BBCEEC3|nr:MBL fold metallo-hydrolase [Halodesulfurarchaeum sp.]
MEITCLTEAAETFTANVYLVEGQQSTLVDAGAMPGIDDTVSSRVATLDSIVLTHRHADHVDQLDAIQRAFEPTVYAADATGETVRIEDGDEVPIGGEPFEVVATPGHAPDHLAFVGNSVVFSGDIVVYSDGAFDNGSFGRTDIPGADRETLVESLEGLLERLPDTVESLYPGHGPAFHGEVRAVIERGRERAARGEPKYQED